MDAGIHPNLAQIAASYDDICEQVEMGLMTAADARRAVMGLVARDDQGVQWLISPDDGNWYRRTVSGDIVVDTPPKVGIATPSGWDVSGGDTLEDPRRRVWGMNVDPTADRKPGELKNSTLAALKIPKIDTQALAANATVRRAVAVLAATAIILAGWMFLNRSDDTTVDPGNESDVSTTTVVTIPVPETLPVPGQPGG